MATAQQVNWEAELRNDIGSFTHDPLGFVRYAYPWGEGELANSPGPRTWQANVLRKIGNHLSHPGTHFRLFRLAIASGKGPGKSALTAFIVNWALSTFEDCKVVITANTGTQLATKTQPELAKWTRLAINRHWFDVKATSLTLRGTHDREWRTDLIPWSKENMEAFSGLHNQGKRMVVIFDEASGIHDTIWDNVEGTFTDADTEMLWFAFGNPTRTHGRFRECFGKYKHLWDTMQIDSRTVEGINVEELNRKVETYGEDSYHVRIWIRGEFPLVGSDQFIPPADVDAARRAHAEGYESLPKILSCDVARFGDDQTVIGTRQGRKAVILEKLRGKDTVFVAERVIHWKEVEHPDAIVVDGDGLGAGVVDQMRARNHGKGLFEFHGNATPTDIHKYLNKRAEVWGEMRDWMPNGDIPDDPELADDLTGPLYDYNANGQIVLESKDDMKERGLASPDSGDMLAMSFAVKVAPKTKSTSPPARENRGDGLDWMAA